MVAGELGPLGQLAQCLVVSVSRAAPGLVTAPRHPMEEHHAPTAIKKINPATLKNVFDLRVIIV